MTVGFVQVGGRRTRVRIEGDPAAPPLVLVHGIGRSLEDWAAQFPRLRDTHRLIALDLPGWGLSERVPQRTTLTLLARAVLDTIDELGETRPVHIVGNSLGGAVAQQALVLEPERVAGLVLIASAGFGREVTPMLRMLATPVIGRVLATHPNAGSIALAERICYADPALVTPTRIEHAIQMSRQPDGGQVMWEMITSLATTSGGIRSEWRDQLTSAVARLARPTLVMWGDRDKVLPAAHLQTARRTYPHASTRLFAGVGHMPQVERPDEVAALIRKFVPSRVPTTAHRSTS